MTRSRWCRVLALALVLAGCRGGETAGDQPEEAVPPLAAPAPTQLSAVDLAGTWDVRVWNEAGDSLPGFRLMATPDTTTWTMSFVDRPPLPVQALVAGDSVVTRFGPYESVLRPGVFVTTTVVSRLQENLLRGALVARYTTTGPDSILRGRTEGSRAP